MAIGIIIATYKVHERLLNKVLESWIGFKEYPVALCYDHQYFDVKVHIDIKPPVKLLCADKHYGWQEGERKNIFRGTRWLVEQGCDTVLKISGDHYVRNPWAVRGMYSDLQKADVDFLCAEWGDHQLHFGTDVFFGNLKPLLHIAQELDDFDRVKGMFPNEQNHIERYCGLMAKRLGYKWEQKNIEWWSSVLGWLPITTEDLEKLDKST